MVLSAVLLLVLCGAAGGGGAGASPSYPRGLAPADRTRLVVDPVEHVLRDAAGRVRVFHGANVVFKEAPWHPRLSGAWSPFESFTERDAALLREWGLNAIRLGTMWPGLMPEGPGRFNASYVKALGGMVDFLAGAGVWVLHDAHQDTLSHVTCGEGVPAWAVKPGGLLAFPEPLDRAYAVDPRTGFPSAADCAKHAWADYYFSYAVATAFQALYDNEDGIADAFAASWAHVVRELGPRAGRWNVIGYEMINEPFAGDIYEDPALMVPGVADRENLAPFYERLQAAIRGADEEALVFFEPVTWDDFGVGFEGVPGGQAFLNRSVLAVHFYVPPDIDVPIFWAARDRDASRLRTGLFLTEFGIGADARAVQTMDEADERLCSWTTWEYKSYDRITGWTTGFWTADGALDMARVRAMSRTYAWAVAGTHGRMAFNGTTARFTLAYTADPAISRDAPTEIYLNEKLHYPSGFTVNLEPATGGLVSWTRPEPNQVQIHLAPNATRAIDVSVTITPR